MKKVHFILGAMLMLTACNDIGDSGTKMSNCGEDLDFQNVITQALVDESATQEKLLWRYDALAERLDIKHDNIYQNCGFSGGGSGVHADLQLIQEDDGSYTLEENLDLADHKNMKCMCEFDLTNSFIGISTGKIKLKFVDGDGKQLWGGEIDLHEGSGEILIR